MTELKKRFQKLVPEHFGGMQHDLMASCELIADEFAIDFAIFIKKEYGNIPMTRDNYKKSLKMYKKTLE